MILKLRKKNPNALMVLGMFFLVLGSVARYLPRIAHVSENLTDATQGFFMGVAIGLMILHLVMQKRMSQMG